MPRTTENDSVESAASRKGRCLALSVMVVAVILAAMVAKSPAAGAAEVEFGSEGSRAGEFFAPGGIAADESTGDLYIVDRGNARGEKWGQEGTFLLAWGAGVADGVSSVPQECEVSCFAGVPGANGGQFGPASSGIAVDSSLGASNGDVYVVDRPNLRVEKFSPTGEFLLTFGHEVNATTHGDVCLAGESCGAGSPSSGPGGFEELGEHGVAVGPTGTVYVADHHRVEEFSPSGVFETEVELAGVEATVESLSVDSAGSLYVMVGGVEGVLKFSPLGVQEGVARDPSAAAANTVIAIGPENDLIVYSAEQEHLLGFAPGGEQVLSISEHKRAQGVAYDAVANAIYILLEDGVRVVPMPTPGPLVVPGSQSASGLTPTGASLEATVIPESAEATSYRFEFGTTNAYGTTTEASALVGGAFEDQRAQASLANLLPDTEYHFRIVASNILGEALGPDMTFRTAPAVSIEGESVTDLTATSVRLSATLNAHGRPSTFHFEYGKTAAYEEGSVPQVEGAVGAGEVGVAVSAIIEHLLPESTYHYRVSSTSSLGTVYGPDQTFTTTAGQSNIALQDGRVWEQVSPTDKRGIALEGIAEEGGLIQAATDGSALTYIALAPLEEEPAGNRSVANSQQLAVRSPAGGWSSSDIATPHERVAGLVAGKESEYLWFAPDLQTSSVEPFGDTPLAPALMGEHGERTPYLRDREGAFLPLVTVHNVPSGVQFGGEEPRPGLFSDGVSFVTATPDAHHVVFSSPAALTKDAVISTAENLYEWSDGVLTLVSVLPNKEVAAAAGLSSNLGLQDRQVRNALSSDGARVVFSTSEGLYLRDVGLEQTLQLDLPAKGASSDFSGTAVYQDATSDGRKVLFTDGARLTADSTAKSGQPDLYLCDVVLTEGSLACELHDLTVDSHRNEAALVRHDLIGISEDGRYVYFVANGALSTSAVSGNCEDGNPWSNNPGASCNLYLRDTQTETTRLVAVLSNRDAADWQAGAGENLGEMTARVSGNGRFLTFMSTRSLTGFDNRDAISGEPDAEVYLYDATEPGNLRCVSCSATGARPEGMLDTLVAPGALVDRPRVWGAQWLAASVPGWTRATFGGATYQSRYLDDSGRLFFNSATQLVPVDQNHREDVYEYEPSGVGACQVASGCVSLISSGQSDQESAFLDGSESGDDVFFMTASQLVSGDSDNALDIYDAHVCASAGTCAAPPQEAALACASANTCRPSAPSQASVVVPPSATVSADGNVSTQSGGQSGVHGHTAAQQLKQALRRCHRLGRRQRRHKCEVEARRRYRRAVKRAANKRGK